MDRRSFIKLSSITGGGLGIPTYVRGMPRIAGVRFYYSY